MHLFSLPFFAPLLYEICYIIALIPAENVEFCSDQADGERSWTLINAEERRFFSGSASICVNQRPIFLFHHQPDQHRKCGVFLRNQAISYLRLNKTEAPSSHRALTICFLAEGKRGPQQLDVNPA
ncbi:MAG: hypothetical protein KF753_08610 [Caldilineaceae bacterium]|nr:hypothetical protein [Caldilineaceae bacterium]